MNSGKAGDADGLLIDLIKDADDFLQAKLAAFFYQFFASLFRIKNLEKYCNSTIRKKRDIQSI